MTPLCIRLAGLATAWQTASGTGPAATTPANARDNINWSFAPLHHMIRLSINGEMRRVAQGASVAGLVEELALSGKRIAVEKNGEIVPRSKYGETPLTDGDQLEIVVAVGGG